jgi:hypothetical protein
MLSIVALQAGFNNGINPTDERQSEFMVPPDRLWVIFGTFNSRMALFV